MQQTLFTHETGQAFTSDQYVPIYKIVLIKEETAKYGTLRQSDDAERLLKTYLEGVDREHFVVLLLDRKNTVVGLNTVAIGSLSSTVVHPREVFKPAILGNAAAIICGHNHPSGDPTPSPEDKQITSRLVDAGKILGIQVLDHIIIGEERGYSFADNGQLE